MADHKIRARLGLDKKEFDDGLKNAGKEVDGFSKGLSMASKAFAALASATALVTFAKSASELAMKMEGVKTAFESLNRPDMLDELRKATRGTVTDLQLMQKAVQAKNFKIPLDQLATYFEFATKRAIQTGESVDYLVDSIITGIGRKSVLVMDNLGISAVELQEEVKKVGDFGAAAGNIIRRELGDMGDVADTTAIQVMSIKTAFENIKTAIGGAINQSELFQKSLRGISNFAKNVEERGFLSTLFEKRSTWEKWKAEKDRLDVTREGIPVSLMNGPAAEVVAYRKVEKSAEELAEAAEKAADALKKLKEANEPFYMKGFRGDSLYGAVQKPIQGGGLARGGADLAGGPEAMEGMEDMTRALNIQWEAVNILSDAFYNLFTSTGDGFKDMANSIINSIQRIAAEMAAKAAIFGLIRLLFPGSDLAVGATKGLWSMFGINGFATGGMVYGPQLAMVGENSSRSNPEVIAPLDKLVGMMGNNIKVEVVGTISARDIKLSNRRSY